MNAFANTSTLSAAIPPITSYTLATDGACKTNPGRGGWGLAIIAHTTDLSYLTHESAGGEDDTTNIRMGLKAALEGLRAVVKLRGFDPSCPINVRSDSQYLVYGYTKWLSNWKRNGWKGSEKKPVKNKDLWESLDEIASGLEVTWTWVKGRAGDPMDKRADELAHMGLKSSLESSHLTVASAVRSLLSDREVHLRNSKQEWVEQLLEAHQVVSEALDFATTASEEPGSDE